MLFSLWTMRPFSVWLMSVIDLNVQICTHLPTAKAFPLMKDEQDYFCSGWILTKLGLPQGTRKAPPLISTQMLSLVAHWFSGLGFYKVQVFIV